MTAPSIELIVYRLDELKRGQDEQREEATKLREEVVHLREEIAGLRVKSGVWGAVAGIIPAAIAVVWGFLKGH